MEAPTRKTSATKERKREHVERIVACSKLLQKGVTDWDIIRHVCDRFEISQQAARSSLKFARRMLARKYAPRKKNGKVDLQCLVFDAIAVYDGIIQDSDCPHAVRVAAQREKCRILGLETVKVQLDARVQTQATVKTVVELAKENDEVRDLLVKLGRAMPQNIDVYRKCATEESSTN
jgi:hypothetical protein